ncbi:MAG: gliding motility-associated C-terminal domain-containing protein [Flavobacteriales bacterium]|nr:gliding motility-associated C-terminal domain-containing protein [Flavobacteriales bacterium]MCB9203843.1 gliding motility-associated C-terminal domain-containing protein [Flavobacteriales bacterium]
MRILFSVLTLIAFQAHATIDVVDFSTTLVCEGSQTTLTSTSTVSGGATITDWNWDLDADGQFDDAFGASINHQFANAGVYNVGLQIITDMDGPAAAYKLITVNPVPSADFSAPDVCEGTATALADQSTISSGSITSWQWDLDNDGFYDDASGSLIANDFVNAGSYPVGLQVTSDQGCQSTTSEIVVVDPMPTVAFSVSEVCLGNQTELTAITTISSGQITDYDWELNGNGFFDDASGNMITNQFSADGDYQIGLQVTSDQGCVNDTFQLVTIAPFPFVGFLTDDACQNQPVDFTNITNNVVGTITYDWTFGGEGTSTDFEPTFTFSGAGPATVTLIGTTSFGCADTMFQVVEVFPTPEADFTFTEVCFGNTTNFTNTTDPKGSTIQSYFWDFGDLNTGAGSDPFHFYNSADSFLVNMVAYTTDGCRDTVEHYVNVWALPTPQITGDGPYQFCEGDDVVLTVNPVGSPTIWSTGELTQSITVDTTGLYEVQITDEHGCNGQTQVLVYSTQLPELTLSNDTTVSLGEIVPLWVEGADDDLYTWVASTYLDDANSPSPISSPKESITYTVTGGQAHLTSDGVQYVCYSSDQVSIEVLVDYNLKPVNLFSPNGDNVNERFFVDNLECYPDCIVKVYNRWGAEVYSSDKDEDEDVDGYWTGARGGDELPDGTYYYTIECDGKDGRFDGSVTILRDRKRRY